MTNKRYNSEERKSGSGTSHAPYFWFFIGDTKFTIVSNGYPFIIIMNFYRSNILINFVDKTKTIQ